MPRANTATRWKELTREERRERRRPRREKQREDNVGRAAKMHLARKELNSAGSRSTPRLKAAYVGYPGWRYWKWRGLFYPADLPPLLQGAAECDRQSARSCAPQRR